MTLYFLYRLGVFLAMSLPITLSYSVAVFMANIYYFCSRKDRMSLIGNIDIVLGKSHPDNESRRIARAVFGNFAKYLVDFFRFQRIDKRYIDKYVKIDGLENIKDALARGKGVICLSAHIGNWELGGTILPFTGYPISAVVLTHKHKKINDFFRRQRMTGKVTPIEIGVALKSCYSLLRSNGMLALLGDRDFTKNGIQQEFFGKKTLIPKGPAALSYRIGSAIVPSFMIRNADDTFTLYLEKPIYPDTSAEEDAAIKALTKECVSVIESYIRKYPSQWYAFKEVWTNGEVLRPDTVL